MKFILENKLLIALIILGFWNPYGFAQALWLIGIKIVRPSLESADLTNPREVLPSALLTITYIVIGIVIFYKLVTFWV